MTEPPAVKRPRGLLPLAAVGAAAILVPLAGLLATLDLDSIATLRTRSAVAALRLSLSTATAAMTASVVLGLPIGWLLAHSDQRRLRAVRALLSLPLVIPPVVSGLALLSTLSTRSWIGTQLRERFGVTLTYSTTGVIIAATFVSLPLFITAAEVAFRNVDHHYEELSAGLGARPWRTFRDVTIPLALPGLGAAAALAWARALGEFGATLTFAGNIEGRTRTAPLAVYLALDTDRQTGLALSTALMALAFVVLVALRGRWLPGVARGYGAPHER